MTKQQWARQANKPVDLTGNPFFLDEKQVEWVRTTLARMNREEKIGQLFCLCSVEGTREEAEAVFRICKPGGMMLRPMRAEQAVQLTAALEKLSSIPMLIAANLEKGGNGIVTEGTLFGSPLEIAATDDPKMAEKLGVTCAEEAAAVGCNWAFAPIVDIDCNFRNPITNTRTYGSDPERVKRMGLAYLGAVQSRGIAACFKHFPGDGVDERDQHLLSSINSLSCRDWDRTYGAIYRACIDAGVLTCMVGHILQPSYSKKLDPSLRDEDILPASLSPELKLGLLRGKLGFNGLIVTDATTMAGFSIPMQREKAVPAVIASGADMFLFSRNLEEDVAFMRRGVEEGTITPERLDEAVTRILALKAALRLNKRNPLPSLEEARAAIGSARHRGWAAECADRSVTLVKEEKGVLPISAEKYRRILYCPIEGGEGFIYTNRAGVCAQFQAMLEQEGFQVDVFVPKQGMEGLMTRTTDITEHYDLILYLANMSTKSNQTVVRIEWQQPMGANVPCYIHQVPTVFVSVENPYHLQDVPRVRTFVNAYCSDEANLKAVLDKLMGRSPFKGINPVDPFCGKWDTRL